MLLEFLVSPLAPDFNGELLSFVLEVISGYLFNWKGSILIVVHERKTVFLIDIINMSIMSK